MVEPLADRLLVRGGPHARLSETEPLFALGDGLVLELGGEAVFFAPEHHGRHPESVRGALEDRALAMLADLGASRTGGIRQCHCRSVPSLRMTCPAPTAATVRGSLFGSPHCTENCTDYQQSGPVLSGAERSSQTQNEGRESGLVTLSRWRSRVRIPHGSPEFELESPGLRAAYEALAGCCGQTAEPPIAVCGVDLASRSKLGASPGL